MRRLILQLNRWSFWWRLSLLLGLIVIITLSWYLFILQPVLAKLATVNSNYQQQSQQLNQVSQLQAQQQDFVFQHDLAKVELKQVLKSLNSQVSDVKVTSFAEADSKHYPGGAAKYAAAERLLKLRLLPAIVQNNVQLKFTGGFHGFTDYLQAIQNSPYTIYFNRVEFAMNAFPQAQITLNVFTLSGG